MNTFAIDDACKPSRIGSIAIISGTLLGAIAAGPALSADLPYDVTPYRQGYYRNSFISGCYQCSCCGWRVAPVEGRDIVEERPPFPVAEPPLVERGPMADRYWGQRDYIERGYPYNRGPRYAYPDRYRYPYYNPGLGADSYNYGQVPFGERRRSGYGGGQYPPAPAAYEYEAQPRPPYRYGTSPRPYDYRPAYEYDYRPSYEYGTSRRRPAMAPGGYYNSGYAE